MARAKKRVAPSAVVAEDFYELKFLSTPQLSPEGDRVAYAVRTSTPDHKGYQSALWVCEVSSGRARQFTSGLKQDRDPRWSPDGTRLLFVSNRSGTPQLWLIPLDGGEAEQRTYLPQGATQPCWSPDGTRVLFVSRANNKERAQQDRKGIDNAALSLEEQAKRAKKLKQQEQERTDPRLIERTIYRAGTDYFDDRCQHLYTLDLEGGTVARLSGGQRDHLNPCWSHDGKAIYCGAKRAGEDDSLTHDLLRYPAKKGKPKRIVQAQSWSLVPKPSPNGKQLAYLDRPEHHAPAQNAQLIVINADGTGKRRLGATLDNDVFQFEWRHDGQGLLLSSANRGALELHYVSLKGNRLQTYFSDQAHMVRGFSLAKRSDRVAALVSTPEGPGDVVVFEQRCRVKRRLTRANALFLQKKAVQPVEEMHYKSPDGTNIQGWLIKPPHFRKDHKYPLALEIHGGPHVMWSPAETTMWHEWQLLASAGYVVFFCNPRGSDGYGFSFKDAIHGDWGSGPTQDLLAGVDMLLERGLIDPKRLCVTGGSYGGYMTAWLVGHAKRFAAAVSQRGVYDLLSFYGTTDVPRLIEGEFDTRPWEDPLRLWQASPLAHVERIHTPLLILHSERDFRVPIATAEGLYMALKKLGRKVKFVRFPDEGHELSRSGRPQRVVGRLNHILAWFDTHAGKRATRKTKRNKNT